jgi:neutral trehalase
MELADVGLLSLYIWDCQNLSEIAEILGKKDDGKELRSRAESYGKVLKSLWSEQKGIYMNKRTDTGNFSESISPTNFYPLLTGIPTQDQAERMIKEHFFNPDEFYSEWVMPSIARNHQAFSEQNYWRGRIWAPLNFLVYVGMSNYNLTDARKDMVRKSYNLLMQNWLERGGIYENYNAITGYADDVPNSDPYYHWGALLGFMSFIEDNYIPKPSNKFFLKKK